MDMSSLPPYGTFAGHYRDLGLRDERIMRDWRPADAEADRFDSFHAWRLMRRDRISRMLWPRFEAETGAWVGDATAFAADMTVAEIDVMMSELRSGRFEMDKKPVTRLMRSDILTHLEHYRIEDSYAFPNGDTLTQYDRTLTELEHKAMLAVIDRAFGDATRLGTKVSGVFWFKPQLMRPRPYQVALIAKRPGFSCEIANTAHHSAMNSGHCFQGMMIGCAIYEDWLRLGLAPSPDRLRCLAQYSVDWGDRRVFAGVHYPTDNLVSWSLALDLISEIFDFSDKIRAFAVDAIVRRSRVFRIVNEVYRANGGALAPAVAYLDDVLPKPPANPSLSS